MIIFVKTNVVIWQWQSATEISLSDISKPDEEAYSIRLVQQSKKKETAFAVTSHAAKSNDKLHSDTSSDYLANQQSSLNENDQDLV